MRVCGRVEQGLVEERFGEVSILEHEHATEGKMSRHENKAWWWVSLNRERSISAHEPWKSGSVTISYNKGMVKDW